MCSEAVVKLMLPKINVVLSFFLSDCSIQAQSSGPACPVPVGVTDHLLKVGEALMKNEVATHEQGAQGKALKTRRMIYNVYTSRELIITYFSWVSGETAMIWIDRG